MSRRTINAAYRAAIKARLVASGHYASQTATVVPGSRRPWTAFHATSICPACGSALTVRKNRAKGDTFAGCTAYPDCRFTISFPPLRSKPMNDTS